MNNDSLKIKYGAVISYVALVINIMAGFLYTPWMVNRIGQADYGIYTLAMSVINFFLLDFGLSASVARFVSLYRAKGEEDRINKFLGVTEKVYLVIDAVILLVLAVIYFGIDVFFDNFTAQELIKFKCVYAIVAVYSVANFPFLPLNGIYNGYERFVELKSFDLIGKLVNILTVVLVLLLEHGLYALVLTNVVSQMFVTIVKWIYIKNREKISIKFKNSEEKMLKEIMSFSGWMFIISIAQRFIININPTIIGAIVGPVEVSVYSVGMSIEGYIWTLSNALNGLFLPKVVRLATTETNPDNINRLMIKVGRLQLFIVGAVVCGFVSMGKEFVVLWMGEEFVNSYFIVICMAISGLVTFTQEIANNYLMAINEVKWRVLCFVSSAVVSFLSALILTSVYGAVGTAIATAIGTVSCQIIFMNIVYQKKFKLNITNFFRECHLKFLPVMIIMTVIGFTLQKFLPTQSLVWFFVKAVVWAVVYVLLSYLFVFNNEEKGLIKKVAEKFIRIRRR